MKEPFDIILKNYEPMLHKIIRQLHIYNTDEDWLQIAKIALWEAYERFDEKKGIFLNFAYTYVKGRLLVELTKRNKVKEDLYDHQTITEQFTVDFDSSLLLEYYLTHLSPNEQIWLKETIENDLSIHDIARKYQVSPSTVKYWRKNAREKLSIFMKKI